MNNVRFISVTGKKNNKFVGLELESNYLNFYLPETLVTEGLPPRMSIAKKIILCIEKAREETSLTELEPKNDNFIDDFSISSMRKLIEFFLTNGPFNIYKDEVTSIRRHGKIDWKKTIQNGVIRDQSSLYFNIIRASKVADREIEEIYEYCLNTSIYYVGWFYDIYDSHLNTTSLDLKKAIHRVRNELLLNYKEDNHSQLIWMLNILNNQDFESLDKRHSKFGCYNFDFVYENMVDNVFGDSMSNSIFNPSSLWEMADGNVYYGTKLRPDTILITDKESFVIDAKNYRYPVTQKKVDLPGTSSLLKQLAYGEYVGKRIGMKPTNIYLLPHRNENKSNVIKYLGYTVPTWNATEMVFAFSVDMLSLINSYISNSSLSHYLIAEMSTIRLENESESD